MNSEGPTPAKAGLSRRGLLRHVGGVALVWAGTAALIFAIYAIVERQWLTHLGHRQRELILIGRGLAVSLATAVATTFYLLRRLAPALDRGLASAGADRDVKVRREDGITTWILGLRWVAVLSLAAVVAFATLASGRLPHGAAPSLWFGVSLLALFNFALTVLDVRWLSSQRSISIQIGCDVALLAWMLHQAGGVQNPFAGFFVFHAVLGGIVLEPPRAKKVAAVVATFVLVLTALEATILPPGCILSNDGTCRALDGMSHAAYGVAIAVTVVGCAFIVIALVRRLVEERSAIALERAKLHSILDCMGDAVIYAHTDGSVGLRNKVAEQLWPDASLRVCHPVTKWDALLERLRNPPDYSDHPILETNGRSMEATYAPVHDDRGGISGVVLVARDITERIQAQAARMEQERMAVVGKLAASLAHEINNPLGAIALFTQHALTTVKKDDPLEDHLRTIARNTDLCKKTVRDLLDYARRRPPERRALEIEALLDDVTRTLAPAAERARVKIDRTMPGKESARVHGDPDQLHQALVNLGLNAIDAMPKGGTLLFSVDRSNGHVRIDVIDTGTGISEEARERVFAPFFTTKAQGTGLGLAVVHDVVVAHGGKIELETEVGRGTTFHITLPAKSGDTKS